MQVVGLMVYGKLGSDSGSIARLPEEFKLYCPTIITDVARVYERLKEQIEKIMTGKIFLIRSIFHSAFKTK
jgi:long-subunit acyl-CoA synthetase (AMP-forming)